MYDNDVKGVFVVFERINGLLTIAQDRLFPGENRREAAVLELTSARGTSVRDVARARADNG